jgi:hypothetical protein
MQKILFYFLLPVACTLFLVSCTEVLDVKLDKENDRVVIDGLVTNENKPFSVRLSRTLALDDKGAYPVIKDAFVTIGDNTGNLDTLILQGDSIYVTNGPRQGVPGRTYFLTVRTGGTTYTAQDILTVLTPVDSIYTVFLRPGDAFGVTEAGLFGFYNTTDPPNEKNYYMDESFRNGKRVLGTNSLDVFDDRFLAPVVEGVRISGRFEPGDTLRLERFSLSEAGYNYLNGVVLQLQNDGGFFGTPPANAPNNLSGGALGFFRASSVTKDTLLVQ